jgi:hypothetical protein
MAGSESNEEVRDEVYNYPTTRSSIEALRASSIFRRICGFVSLADVPSEATFSRAFGEFAGIGLGEKVHQTLVAQRVRGEVRELPVHCDEGTKKNSQGYKASWRGFKWHADVSDYCLTIRVALTAASLHDSQVAIPLMKLTSARVDYLYDLMDAASDAQPIYLVSRSLGHVPLIDKNGRGREVVPLPPHEAARYKERTVAERFNVRLKEELGGDDVMVRGAKKVGLHLMFGAIALLADQLLKLIS